MTHHLSPQLSLVETCPDLIIDGRLAFAEHGLLISLALAAQRRCWLVQGLWALLQRYEVIDYPEFADPAEDAEAMMPRVAEWHAVWTATTLLERFYWLGDILFESRLPPAIDPGIVQRTQTFAAQFENLTRDKIQMTSLAICARDAAALAAVRATAAPVVMTTTEKNGRPRFCRLLEHAGISSVQIRGESAKRMAKTILGAPAPMAVELALQGGVKLALVSLLAPRAVAALLEEEPDFEPEDLNYSEENDPWRGARAIWCEVAA